jgi:hypothetical protein
MTMLHHLWYVVNGTRRLLWSRSGGLLIRRPIRPKGDDDVLVDDISSYRGRGWRRVIRIRRGRLLYNERRVGATSLSAPSFAPSFCTSRSRLANSIGMTCDFILVITTIIVFPALLVNK